MTKQQILEALLIDYNLTLHPDKLFWTSDTHFGHANIIKFCNRPFDSANEMDEAMIKNWNEIVPHDGIVFHLGDVSFHKSEKTKEILNRLNGKIYLIRGNHEKPALNCYDRFEWIKDSFTLNVDLGGKKPQEIIMSHYPYLIWDKSHFSSWTLYGHCHDNVRHEVNQNQYRFDVGVDAWNFKPVSFKQVAEEMARRKIVPNLYTKQK